MLEFQRISQTSHRIDKMAAYASTPTGTVQRAVIKKGERPYSRFFFILRGTAVFTFNGNSLTVPPRSILYLPYDAPYQCNWTDSDGMAYLGINFVLYNSTSDIINLCDEICIAVENASDSYLQLFQAIHESWVGSIHPSFECMKLFYEILALMQSDANNKTMKSKHHQLHKAILYLEKHYTENTPIEDLAQLCNMSPTAFRRNFKEELGTSPVKYRNHLRMQKALAMLKEQDFTISEISELLNFTDVYYFSKLFKSTYGFTPSHVIRNNPHVS